MKIAIDGNEANVENKVGIGEYNYRLLDGLSKADSPHSFTILLKYPPRVELPSENSKWMYEVLKPSLLWTQFALPLKLYRDRTINIIFSPTHYGPRFSPIPSIIAIMDLSYIYYPQMFKSKDLLQLKNWTHSSVKKASKIITISKFTKDNIVSHYNKDPNDIYVTYPGINRKIYNTNYDRNNVEKIKSKYNLNQYLMFVGTIQPRKNIERLVEAFILLKQKVDDLKLIIIGKKGWLYEKIMHRIEDQKTNNSIIYLDYLPETEVATLYNGALASILPSLYEGFGLTVIESMACGCPIICSNVSSLPEIAGNAAVFVNPLSVESISDGILKIISPDQRYYRQKLIADGLKQSEKYSWSDTVSKTLEVFDSIKLVQ